MQVGFGVAASAAVRTLDDVTIISEATARALHRLKQEEETRGDYLLHSLFNTICHGDVVSHLVATPSVHPVQDALRFELTFVNKTLSDFAMLPAIVHTNRHMSNMHTQLQHVHSSTCSCRLRLQLENLVFRSKHWIVTWLQMLMCTLFNLCTYGNKMRTLHMRSQRC